MVIGVSGLRRSGASFLRSREGSSSGSRAAGRRSAGVCLRPHWTFYFPVVDSTCGLDQGMRPPHASLLSLLSWTQPALTKENVFETVI